MEDTEKKQETIQNSTNELTIIDHISYDCFFRDFLSKNCPCLIRNIAEHWESSELWVESNKPCFEYLRNQYGKTKIIAYNCQEKYFNSHVTREMRFNEYIEYWINYIENDYRAELPLYYLKDWHLKNEFKDNNFYEVPVCFSSDWLNEYLTSSEKDDYRFVYMGPKGTWTPFHQDVFSSYSWSVNICGMKKWVLLPPNEEKKLLNELGDLPFDIGELNDSIVSYEVIQHPGDALFVPTGWHHQVWNLADTISINHNWINACNIRLVWKNLENNLNEVKKEISDCKNMDNYYTQCQLILRSTFGMNFEDFLEFLDFITLKRLEDLSKSRCSDIDGPSNVKYLVFDLHSLKDVLQLFSNHEDYCEYLEETKSSKNVEKMLENISRHLNQLEPFSMS